MELNAIARPAESFYQVDYDGWHNTAYQSMLAEKTRLKNRLDRMYEDRLDEKVTEEFYETKRREYTDRIEDLDIKIAKHDRADINYHEFGLRILELAKNAKKLFESANPTEKQELLRFLLSNSTLKDGRPEFALKSPFFEIAKRSPLGERSAWGALVDDFRTLDWPSVHRELCAFPTVAVRELGWEVAK